MRKNSICIMAVLAVLIVFSIFSTAAAGALPSSNITVPDFTNGASTEEVSVTPDSVFRVDIQIFPASIVSVEDISFEFTDYGDFTLIEGFDSVRDFTLGETYIFKFYVPESFNKEKVYIRYAVSYTYKDSAGVVFNGKKNFFTTVKYNSSAETDISGTALAISGFEYPDSVMKGADTAFKLNVINKSAADYKNAELSLYYGNKLIVTDYIGTIKAESKTPVEFSAAFDDTGNLKYKLVIKYEGGDGKSKSLEKEFTMTVTGSKPLEISGIILPDTISEQEKTEIKFGLVNKNKAPFSNAHAYLYKGDKTISESYIGAILPESRAEGVINCRLYAKDDGNYTLAVIYNDHTGKEQTIKETIKINISQTNTGSTNGILKIQSIYSPHEQLTATETGIEFAVTNPGDTAVKGVEAYIYDETGKELDSIYISEIEGNSSSEHKLRLISASEVGVNTYKLKITYSENGKSRVLDKSFSVNTVLEVKEGEGGGKSEKPANLKVQKIEVPGSVYSGVKTNVPVIFVNAGKGTAYNTELYVVNEAGDEIAREYVGSITASESAEASFILLCDKIGDFTYTLYATYENADETVKTVSKPFSAQSVEYRITISDITGYEYIMTGNPLNIEFSVLNSGTVKMLNTTAYLNDTAGNEYGECYIGNIDPSVKKERQKFNKLMFNTAGKLELIITLTYENEDMQKFEILSVPFTAEVMEMNMPEMDGMPEIDMDPGISADSETEQQGVAPWIIWLAGGGGALLIVAVIIIVIAVRKRKRIRSTDEEDLDYFYEELRGGGTRENQDISDKQGKV